MTFLAQLAEQLGRSRSVGTHHTIFMAFGRIGNARACKNSNIDRTSLANTSSASVRHLLSFQVSDLSAIVWASTTENSRRLEW